MSSKSEYNIDHLHEKELGRQKPPFNAVVSFVALFWAILQLWVASPIQYDIASYFNANWLILNDAEIRSIHLSFGMFLVFFLFPIHDYKNRIIRFLSTTQNLIFSIVGSFAALYIFIFYGEIAKRIGMASQLDVIVSTVGVVLLLEAARRTVGIAMTITATIFLLYCYFGQYVYDIISHNGHSISAIASHMWLSGEGVFGTPLGVSADFIFLYVLFGNLLEKTGAGNFFVQLAFSLLGRFKAGPAKAAVVSSGLMGMISGSSIANTITVGSITIPLMKKMGLSAEKAASIEVSAGVNGQVTPPIMGAAAFLIAEYLSMPYYEIVKIAFLPSLLTYISLLYIVHIEGCKINMRTVMHVEESGAFWRIIRFALSFTSVIVTLGALYYIIEGFNSFVGLKKLFGSNYTYVMMGLLSSFYVFLMWYNSKSSALDQEINYEKPIKATDVLKKGLHHFIPLVILIWCLIIENLSPALSAFWSILFLVFELFITKSLVAFFSKNFDCSKLKEGLFDVGNAMISGAKSMIIVSIATAVAGIIVGSISLTGVGLKITSILDYLSNSSIMITLLLTALTCIILGMGMPTTACYIIVSTLMIPALDYFIKKHDMDVPIYSLHLFVFYFGLMADVTPPVGLASYAAAAIAHANSLKTGIVAFSYNIKTMLLPFFFIFNPAILLYKVNGAWQLCVLFVTSIIGILAVTASTQRYFIIQNKMYETIILFVVGIGFLSPQSVMDVAFPKFSEVTINKGVLNKVNHSKDLRMMLRWENFSGDMESKIVHFSGEQNDTIENQLNGFGLEVDYDEQDRLLQIANIKDSSEAFKKIKDNNDYQILKLYFFNSQPNKNMTYMFSFFLLLGIYLLQFRRNKRLKCLI